MPQHDNPFDLIGGDPTVFPSAQATSNNDAQRNRALSQPQEGRQPTGGSQWKDPRNIMSALLGVAAASQGSGNALNTLLRGATAGMVARGSFDKSAEKQRQIATDSELKIAAQEDLKRTRAGELSLLEERNAIARSKNEADAIAQAAAQAEYGKQADFRRSQTKLGQRSGAQELTRIDPMAFFGEWAKTQTTLPGESMDIGRFLADYGRVQQGLGVLNHPDGSVAIGRDGKPLLSQFQESGGGVPGGEVPGADPAADPAKTGREARRDEIAAATETQRLEQKTGMRAEDIPRRRQQAENMLNSGAIVDMTYKDLQKFKKEYGAILSKDYRKILAKEMSLRKKKIEKDFSDKYSTTITEYDQSGRRTYMPY